MIKADEDALICDLAETYHVYNYRELPINLVASLAYGLGYNSRIKRKINNQQLSTEEMLLISILDKLNILIWQQTKDGQKGRNQPKSILAEILDKQENNVASFNTIEEFERTRQRIIERK